MAEIKVKCPYCGSEEVVRYGKNSNTGKQRFLCKNPECSHKTFQVEYKNNACKPGMREKIVKMVMNGSGTRDTGRVLSVAKDTVTSVLKKTEKFAKPVYEEYLKELNAAEEKEPVDVVICNALAAEMDEMWIFYHAGVGKVSVPRCHATISASTAMRMALWIRYQAMAVS